MYQRANRCQCDNLPFQGWCARTSVGQWGQPVGHSRGTLTGQYILAENHRIGKQLEQRQQQGCFRKHWLHNPGSTGCSYERWTGRPDIQLQTHECLNVKECAGLGFITLINIKIIKDHFQSGTKTQHLTCTTPGRPDAANLAWIQSKCCSFSG